MNCDPFDMLADVIRSRAEPWREHAACRGLPTDWFYPTQGNNPDPRAFNACNQCTVRDECWADGRTETYGMWAGDTTSSRRNKHAPKPITHGTDSGYKAHLRRGEAACASCREAHAGYVAAQKGDPPFEKPDIVVYPEMVGPAQRWALVRDEGAA